MTRRKWLILLSVPLLIIAIPYVVFIWVFLIHNLWFGVWVNLVFRPYPNAQHLITQSTDGGSQVVSIGKFYWTTDSAEQIMNYYGQNGVEFSQSDDEQVWSSKQLLRLSDMTVIKNERAWFCTPRADCTSIKVIPLNASSFRNVLSKQYWFDDKLKRAISPLVREQAKTLIVYTYADINS